MGDDMAKFYVLKGRILKLFQLNPNLSFDFKDVLRELGIEDESDESVRANRVVWHLLDIRHVQLTDDKKLKLR